MRTFLAIPIPADIKEAILNSVLILKQQYPLLRWVAPENYHLTLSFLGELTEAQLNSLDKKLQDLNLPKSFTLGFSRFGAFPSLKNARVFWLGFSTPQELFELHHAVSQAITTVGISLDKRETFKPHLTLARSKDNNTKINILPEISLRNFVVNEFSIYKSELTPKGPIYTVLKNYCLN